MRDLAWGTMEARNSASGGFWQAHSARQALDAGPNAATEHGRTLRAHLDALTRPYQPQVQFSENGMQEAHGAVPGGVLASEDVWRSLVDPRFPYSPEEAEALNGKRVVDKDGRVLTGQPLDLRFPSPVIGGGGRPGGGKKPPPPVNYMPRCCVKRFVYPTFWCTTVTDRPEFLIPRVIFEAEAEFVQGSITVGPDGLSEDGSAATAPDPEITALTIVICSCSCCQFKQYVDADVTNPGGVSQRTPAQPGGARLPVEDCVWVADNREERATPFHGPPPDGRHQDCYGSRDQNYVNSRYYSSDKDARHPPEEIRTGCNFWMRDEPGWLIRKGNAMGGTYKIAHDFVGRIIDTCRGEVPVITKEFRVAWEFALNDSDDTAIEIKATMGKPKVTQVNAKGEATRGQPKENSGKEGCG
jgi:hypothetical protein